MDSVLSVLYFTYILANGECIHRENVQFADKKHKVVLIVRDTNLTLYKQSETFSKVEGNTGIKSTTRKYECKDPEGRSVTFTYTKTLYGYELLFRREDTGNEIKVSNLKMCNHDD
jgi:hypothetical protein